MLIKAGLGKYRPQQQRQVVFSSLELDRLRAIFKEMITTSVPISKRNVKEIFQKEDAVKELLQKASLETIMNRVKYESRIKRTSKTAQHWGWLLLLLLFFVFKLTVDCSLDKCFRTPAYVLKYLLFW